MSPKKLSNIPQSCIHELSLILDTCSDQNRNWRALAQKLNVYTAVEVAAFERKSLQLDGSPSRSMFEDLAMMGKNIDEIFTLVYKMGNYDAFHLLKKSGLVSRSLSGSLKLSAQLVATVPKREVKPEITPQNNAHSHDARSIMKFLDNNGTTIAEPGKAETDPDLSMSLVAKKKDSMTDDILTALRTKGLIEFSYSEVCLATGNFSDSQQTGGCMLGRGSFGTVFKGDLKNTTFAIKKLNLNSDMQARSVGLSQFAVEVLTLSKYRHPHLLELVGYSLDPRAPCLIYYYMQKGSLATVLASPDAQNLAWRTRLRVSEDIAKGLVYLHTATDKPLIHRDLKSANVLLTSDYQAKIGDFGLARLGSDHQNSIVKTNRLQGTMGYISPEAARGNISTKTDTFSYGVLMLELLTNLAAFDPNRGYQNQSLVGLVENKLTSSPSSLDIIGPAGVKWPHPVAKEFTNIAQNCFEDHNVRPTATNLLNSVTHLIQRYSETEHIDRWVDPGSLVLSSPKAVSENRKTVLVITRNREHSNLVVSKVSKLLEGDSSASSLRSLQEMEFHFVTLYDAIIIVCNPLESFTACLQDAINRFNPDLVVSVGLCHGVRGKVGLGDLIIAGHSTFGNVTYSVPETIRRVIGKVLTDESNGSSLWQLPGLLPRPPSFTSSQALLWLSKLIVEVNSEKPEESRWLKAVAYNHSLGHNSPGFLDNMKLYHAKYPCLRTVNMALVYEPTTKTIDPDINLKTAVHSLPEEMITLDKRKLRPKLHVGALSPSDLPYQPGFAFCRHKLCPEDVLGCDVETLQLYSSCSKSETPCVSMKSVCGFADPYEDSRHDSLAVHMAVLGLVQFLGNFLAG